MKNWESDNWISLAVGLTLGVLLVLGVAYVAITEFVL